MKQSIIEERILRIRGLRVMLDTDLAELYGTSTKAINQAVKRNSSRFPSDFMFRLSAVEKEEVVTICDHLAGLKYSKSLHYAFTEHGAIMAALPSIRAFPSYDQCRFRSALLGERRFDFPGLFPE